MAIYMNYDTITGDVKDANFTGWIELSSFQWGIGRSIPSSGGEADREGALPSVSEIVVTKGQDSASGNLMRASTATGDFATGKTVKIAFCNPSTGGGSTAYITYTLTMTLVSGWSQSASGGDGDSRPSESLTLNFTAIEFAFTPNNPDGSVGTPDKPSYDLDAQKGS